MTNISLTSNPPKNKKRKEELEAQNHSHLVIPVQTIFKNHFWSRYHWNGELYSDNYITI